MQKLKLAVVLPILHLMFSVIVLRDIAHFRHLMQLWFAINGPVVLLVDACKYIGNLRLVRPWVIDSPFLMNGPRQFNLLFLICGFVLWYFAGKTIDNIRRGKESCHAKPTFVAGFLEVFLIVCGVRLVFHGLQWILPEYPGQQHAMYSLVDGSIILVWSLILILGPGWKLLNAIRRRSSEAKG